MQNVITGSGPLGRPLLILTAYTVVIIVVSILVYRKKMRL